MIDRDDKRQSHESIQAGDGSTSTETSKGYSHSHRRAPTAEAVGHPNVSRDAWPTFRGGPPGLRAYITRHQYALRYSDSGQFDRTG